MMSTDYAKFMDNLKMEIDAYCKYKEMLSIDDEHLKSALKEIMWDEYLHAKFLRKYLMQKGVYLPEEQIDIERRYRRIENDL